MSMEYITLLFKKHKKHLPARLQGTLFGEFCRYGFMIFISAWILQGVHITNWREVVIRYAIDAILTFDLIALGLHWSIAFFIAHSLNFTLNGQLFAMYTHMGATGVTAEKFLRNTQKLNWTSMLLLMLLLHMVHYQGVVINGRQILISD